MSDSVWYLRDGSVTDDIHVWGAKFQDKDYKRVAETTLSDGKWVSTVWLGLDHSFGDGPPLIFETMVFDSREHMSEVDCERYTTEAEAVAGHRALVGKYAPLHDKQAPSGSVDDLIAQGVVSVIGGNLYGRCAGCGNIVQINKPFIGSLHVCIGSTK